MDFLEAHIDKFIFRVARGYRYTDGDLWVKPEGSRVRVGLTDYLQQKSGDVAFVNLKSVGSLLALHDELAALETIKVDLVIPAPLAGKIVAVNEQLSAHPELVNSDPYGSGWLVEIDPIDPADFDVLLDAETYLPNMQTRAELERSK